MKTENKDRVIKGIFSALSFGVCYLISDSKEALAKITAITGDVAGNWLAQFAPDIFMPWVKKTWLSDKGVNHHIQESLVSSFKYALDDVKEGYMNKMGEISKEDEKGVSQFLTDLKETVASTIYNEWEEQLDREDIFLLIEGNTEDVMTRLNKTMAFEDDLNVFSDEIYLTTKFKRYFNETFGARVKFHFRNELKKGEKAKHAVDLLYNQVIKDILLEIKEKQNSFEQILLEIKENYSNASDSDSLEFYFPLFEKILTDKLAEIANAIKNNGISYSKPTLVQNIRGKRNINKIYAFHQASDSAKQSSYKDGIIKELLDINDEHRVVTLQGMTGVGKSYLAQEVALHFVNEYSKDFDVIWWIDSEEISNKEIHENEDLRCLAREFKEHIDLDSSDWLGSLITLLNKVRFLLIFDNACDIGFEHELTPQNFRKKFFPQFNLQHQKILVTSRNTKWTKYIEIHPWDAIDFQSYFRSCGIPVEDESALNKIHKELGGLPLAATLVAAYLDSNPGLSLSEYSKKLDSEPVYYTIKLDGNVEYGEALSIQKSFLISYRALSQQAKSLVNQVAFLAPDEIPLRDMFENISNFKKIRLANPFSNTNSFESAISQSKNIALLSQGSHNKDYSIHRLLKRSIIDMLEYENLIGESISDVIAVLTQSTNSFKKNDYIFYRKVLSHVESALDYRDSVTNETDISCILKLARDAARYCFETGAIANALRMYEVALAMSSDNIPVTQQINLDRAYSLMLRDDNVKALDIADMAYSYFKNTYSEEDKTKWEIKAYIVIGKVNQRIGQYDLAKKILAECREKIEPLKDTPLGEELYSGILHDLAAILWDEGINYTESINLFDQAIAYKLSKTKDDNNLYLNFSRMIKGVALVLSGDYDKQYQEHNKAFECFASKTDSEFRRYAYTAFYLLHFSWDRQGWKNHSTKGEEQDQLYLKYEDILEGDVKFSLIKSIIGLRKAVRTNSPSIAFAWYSKLYQILQKKFNGSRYIDDGTVAVSAVLDYAQYLLHIKDINNAEQVAKMSKRLITITADNLPVAEIGYHRRREIEDLLLELNLN